MTAPEPTTPVCPSCGNRNTMVTSTGDALCFDDRTEWNPAEVTRITPPPPVHGLVTQAEVDADAADAALTRKLNGQPETADDVLGPPPEVEPEPEHDPFAELVNAVARLEGGQRAVVTEVVDDDHLRVVLGDGRSEVVAFADVESIVPASEVAAHDDELGELFRDPQDTQAALLCAGLIIEAGVQTVASAPEGSMIGLPPRGWLPRDGDLVDVLEQACGIAIAMVIAATEADPAKLAYAADRISAMTLEATKKGTPE